MKKQRPFVVSSLKQVLVLASPGREELMDVVGLIGPCTIPQLAHFLGRSRHSLYYHVKALRRAGLLVESRGDQAGRNAAQYDSPGKPLSVRYDLSSAQGVRAVVALANTRFRSGERGVVRACRSDLAVPRGPARNLWVSHWKGWLSDAELRELNRLFTRLLKVFRNEADSRLGRRPYELTFALAPVVRGFAHKR